MHEIDDEPEIGSAYMTYRGHRCCQVADGLSGDEFEDGFQAARCGEFGEAAELGPLGLELEAALWPTGWLHAGERRRCRHAEDEQAAALNVPIRHR